MHPRDRSGRTGRVRDFRRRITEHSQSIAVELLGRRTSLGYEKKIDLDD